MMQDDSGATARDRLLALLLAENELGDEAASIQRAERKGPIPLSFPQQRLWFLEQMGVAGNSYTIPMNMRLRGRLDVPALQSALTEIVRRHEALRTVFRDGDGEPEQAVLPPHRVELPILDLSGLDNRAREDEVRRLVNVHNARPFDLSLDPVLRAELLVLGEDEHVLLSAVHHIAFDGWSVAVLLRELSMLYQAFRAGEASPLTALPIQYSDFAVWQRRTFADVAENKGLAYWRDQLRDVPPLDLPTDRPRPPVLGFRGGSCNFQLTAETLQSLETLTREHRATTFMALLAAFAALLQRYSGEERIAVGSPIAGRDRIEIEGLIGFFVNSIVLAVDLSGEPSFAEALARVRDVALDAFAHSDVPFERLVEELRPDRRLDRNPLFQVMFALHQREAMAPVIDLEGLVVEPIPFEEMTSRFDLELHVWTDDKGAHGLCTYNLDLFERATIERMMAQLGLLLQRAVASPHVPLSQLPLVTDTERQMLDRWQGRVTGKPQHCLHQLFEEQVRHAPDTLALVFGETRLTLGELNARANRVAHLLISRGVGPEDVVSLCLDRGADMIVAFLGAMKAGACYLPVDPAEPLDRLQFILADSRASVHLTRTRHAALFADSGRPVILLDESAPAPAGQPDADPRIPVQPDNLAYIIYTSGSTGRPKGIEGRHGTIANLVAWHLRSHPRRALRTLQYAQYSFDIFFQELFTSWLSGAACYMVDEAGRRDMNALASFIEHHRLERIFMPFTPLQYLLEVLAERDAGQQIVEVFTAGEQLQTSPIMVEFFRRRPDCRLHNHYGPTECYVVTAYNLAADVPEWPGLPPVGTPVDNVRIHIVDRHLQPVPVGLRGEILIGGAQISRGYRRRPSLTAEKFVPDPFSSEAGARAYRTGDLGRQLADGSIAFLGRMDRQLKIRGFRVEPGEIELVIAEHRDVAQALVTSHRYGPNDVRLTAYVLPHEAGPGRDDRQLQRSLREKLRERLPDHMVPSAFLVLDALPLTMAGKIDRQALPEPDLQAADVEHDSPAARSPTEQAVAEIFAELLQRDMVGRHDNFFELGGHSLLGTRLVSRLRRTLEVDFPLSRLFETPTPAGIAKWATHHRRHDDDIGAPMSLGLTRAPSSFAQRRLWLMDRLGTTGAAYLMPVNLRLRGPLDHRALQRALEAIIHRHAALRTLLVEEDGEPWQHIMPCAPFPLATIDLSGLAPAARSAEVERLIQESANRPFDLARDLPFRAELIQLGEDEHVLLAAFHHAASDGWSINIFFGELGKLYAAFASGGANPLPPLPIQYADFAIWQRDRLTGPVLERELAYWRPLLTDLVSLALPTDRPRAVVERFRGGGFRFTIPQAVTSALRDLAQREGATLYMTLLAAYMALLHRYTGEQRIAVGSPVANRNHDSVEGLLGFFVNSLVMTADIDGSQRFVDLLAAVRKRALGAFDHQDVPFEKLVEELRPVRDLGRNPLFQVVFALQQPEAMTARLELGDVTVEPLDAGEITVRFDLEMHAWLDNGKLQGLCTFDRDLFEETTIRDLVRRYGLLLEAVAADPATPIDRISLLQADERRRLHALAVQPRPTFAESCLHSLVARQAALSPDRIAITAPDRSLSYGELDRRSNQLARHLVEQGLPRGGLVAVMLQRSSDLPLAMLAVLKADGAYVPLDPRYPAGRLAYILEDTEAAFVLVDEACRSRLPAGNARIIMCDGDGASWRALPDTPIVDRSTPSDPAYVIYTSGSSGNPKGVTVSHANAMRLFSATADLFRFDADDVWTCFHSAAFDFSVWEIWGALIYGGRLVMVDHDVIRSPQDFAALLVREEVTVLNQTPSAFAQLSEVLTGFDAETLALRWVIFGGEALDVSLLRSWFDRFGDKRPRLVNCYGITETTVHVTYRLLDRSDLGSPVASPIGQPIADLSLHLLDANLEPVPDNVPAEICVAGPGVAQGYLNVPDLTATRFVEHPFAGGPGRRLYRSGDLARRRPSGEIEYLGRLDSQIKLRGHRIEPAEIAARLREHVLIGDAAVVLRKGPNDDPRLCAYVVPASAAATTGDRAALEERQTANWRTIFDEQLGRDSDPAEDPLFKLTGWLSAYDRNPIPADQMHAWAEGTVEQILSFNPGDVLEIGCGTGILLFRIAPHCKSYHGIDLSEATLAHVRAQVEANAPRFDNVTLEQRTADQLDGLAGRTFDTIVVNSVVQYLPSFGHVVRMIEAALRLLSPGGTIFLGDIRDHRLLLPLHASIQLSSAAPGVPASEILSRTRQQAGLENELLLAPDFFRALQSRLPQIGAVGFLSQRGETPNELNKFRYAAVLKSGPAAGPVDDAPAFDGSALDPKAIEGLLAAGRTSFTVKGLSNALLADDLLRWRSLEAGDAVTTGDLQALQAPPCGNRAENLHRQAARHGYDVVVAPNPDHAGRIDARFARTSARPSPIWTEPLPATDDRALALLASDPLRLQALAGAWPDLRRHLEARLPDYMVPSEYVVLDRLPLTINGKLDIRNLPAPDRRGQERAASTRPPSTPTEIEVAAIFRDLLGIDEIGVDDDFFLLGGHSLLATSLCSRIRLTMAVEVPLLRVFQTPTVAGLADAIEASRWATAGRPQDSEMAAAGEVGEI